MKRLILIGLFSLFTSLANICAMAEVAAMPSTCSDYQADFFNFYSFMTQAEISQNELDSAKDRSDFVAEFKRLYKNYCNEVTKENITLENVAKEVKPIIEFVTERFSTAMGSKYEQQLSVLDVFWYNHFDKAHLEFNQGKAPVFSANQPGRAPTVTLTKGTQTIYIHNCDRDCQLLSEELDNLGKLLNYIAEPLNKTIDMLNVEYAYIKRNLTSWDRYVEESRSQTWLDDLFTSVQYKDDNDLLIGPPEIQYFFLHPNIVIEDVSSALDGEKQKDTFAIELFGMNWWDQKIPFGWSLGAIRSSREDFDEYGGALFIHLGNAYTLGYSKYSDHDGWFITVDLLKAFSDKKQEVKEKVVTFKERMEKLEQRIEAAKSRL